MSAALIHLADIIAHAMEMGSSGERYVPPLSAEAWQRLSLPESILPAVLKQLEYQYGDALALIDLGAG